MSVAVIRFASFTGLRIGEILSIQWEHIDFETGRLELLIRKRVEESTTFPNPL